MEKEKRKQYTKPEIEVVSFAFEDIVTASGDGLSDGGVGGEIGSGDGEHFI